MERRVYDTKPVQVEYDSHEEGSGSPAGGGSHPAMADQWEANPLEEAVARNMGSAPGRHPEFGLANNPDRGMSRNCRRRLLQCCRGMRCPMERSTIKSILSGDGPRWRGAGAGVGQDPPIVPIRDFRSSQ